MTEITTTRRPRRMAREENSGTTAAPGSQVVLAMAAPTATGATTTKAARVLALLQRPQGATLDQLVEATGWLAHTTRAALTGLRKKGHALASEKPEGGSRIYRIAPGTHDHHVGHVDRADGTAA